MTKPQPAMGDRIELISDGEGLGVIGNPVAVERFLDSVGLLSLSRHLGLERLGPMLEVAAIAAANSGRYLKLTKESADFVREFGLMETSTPGVSHAMVGTPGDIRKWIQVETGSGSLVTNPALLSGAAGIMAQLARQQEMREITKLLTTIDEKLDDVRRAQRDTVLAKLDGITFAVKEATTIREHVGRVSEVAWSKVQATSVTIGEAQGYALRRLDALAEVLSAKTKVGDLVRTAKETEREVGVWLAVLARCFQLQEEVAVLELDRVLDASPAELDGHRLALNVARQDRRRRILQKTGNLMGRMDAAAGIAGAHVLLHSSAARAVVDSVNNVGLAVDDFHCPLGIESSRESLEATRWWDAARDPAQLKNAGAEAGRKALVGAVGLGLTAVAVTVASKKDSSS